MNQVNVFTRYEQEENHFTNALVSILRLSKLSDPHFLPRFFSNVLNVEGKVNVDSFLVLRGIDGTVDVELRGDECCIQIETKIASGSLRRIQIAAHLVRLNSRGERLKKLVLLTPDDSRSRYIEDFRSLNKCIVHVEWKRVYGFLNEYVRIHGHDLFGGLVRDFLDLIRKKVFEQDHVGVILKVAFGRKTEVYAEKYLTEFENGLWNCWHTPRECKSLDGTGRKLLLYDKTRHGITVEVEILKVARTDEQPGYPWANVFAPGTIRLYRPAIPLEHIRAIKGFETFGMYRKDRSAFRNLTHEQYRQLVEFKVDTETRKTGQD